MVSPMLFIYSLSKGTGGHNNGNNKNNMIAFFKFILILAILICSIYIPKNSTERFASIIIAIFVSIMILIA